MSCRPSPPAVAFRPLPSWLGPAALVVAVVVVFGAGWRAEFIFDDGPNLGEARALRAGDWSFVWREPADPGSTLAGRPAARAGLALNRALGGHSAASYRAGNIVLHAAGALLLLGVLRRLLGTPGLAALAPAGRREGVALVAATWWALHPLQTAAVSYAVQRVEVQSGVLMLLAVYAFLRGREAGRGWRWLAVGSAAAAAATKETAVVLPVLVWVLDRAAGAGTWAAALRARPWLYAGLAASWLVLGLLALGTGGRGGTAGFDAGVPVGRYLLTQAEAIVTYLGLIVWPSPLVFDYGTALASAPGDVWVEALLVAALAGATAVALGRGSPWGVAGAWFFLLLAPTSSVVPVASQTMAEHRVYLALAAPVAILAVLAARWPGRWPGALALAVCLVLAGLTARRAREYLAPLELWRGVLAERPDNARARVNLALELQKAGLIDEALAQLERAARQDPGLIDAPYNRGVILARLGRADEARAAYQATLALWPGHAEARNNLGNLALAAGRADEAAREYEAAARARPDFAQAHSNHAVALLELGRGDESLAAARRAVALAPDLAEGHFALGNALASARRFDEARLALGRAVALAPENADAHNNLGNVLVELRSLEAALEHYDAALRVRPGLVQALRNSATILAIQGRRAEALARFERLLALDPRDAHAAEAVRRLRPGG